MYQVLLTGFPEIKNSTNNLSHFHYFISVILYTSNHYKKKDVNRNLIYELRIKEGLENL